MSRNDTTSPIESPTIAVINLQSYFMTTSHENVIENTVYPKKMSLTK